MNRSMLPFLLVALFSLVRSAVVSTLAAVRALVVHALGGEGGGSGVELYEGTVYHFRSWPVRHGFSLRARYALVDLDNEGAPKWVRECAMGPEEAREMAKTDGKVCVLLIPPAGGYEQNPLKVYYCYGASGHLVRCLGEVTNTPWGERAIFAFRPGCDTFPKPLHVSPFNETEGEWWSFFTCAPKERAEVSVLVRKREGESPFFVADLALRRWDEKAKASATSFAALMPQAASVGIYLHAAILALKGMVGKIHPKYKDGDGGSSFQQRVLDRSFQSGRCLPFSWCPAEEEPWTRT